MIEMNFVSSSNIDAIGYDTETAELHVRFLKSGLTYKYPGVPQEVYEELMRADSKGSYFNRLIKPVYTSFETV